MNAKMQNGSSRFVLNGWQRVLVFVLVLTMLMNPAASAVLAGRGASFAAAEEDLSTVLAGKYISVMG